ncbi:MAG: segregation/condensation protein A [Nanoarchaeota archaeon]|nr:segregation/condensation protein A [Nanoarchaeota archaeon]
METKVQTPDNKNILADNSKQPVDAIFDIVFKQDDVSWKSIIHDLVKSEQMNPWDIDVSLLANKYIKLVKEMQEHDFRMSGKIILAAAILLKIKSKRLVGQDIEELDKLIASRNVDEEEFYEELDNYDHVKDFLNEGEDNQKPNLIPKTPQPRIRNVSVYDLVSALEQALEVKKRRILNSIPGEPLEMPKKGFNIGRSIKDIYQNILELFKYDKNMTFSNLLPKNCSKETKVMTFIPLLHLANLKKIALKQEDHFGDIDILLRSERLVPKDISDQDNNSDSEDKGSHKLN